jgi:translation initiation factor IF-1
VPGTHAIKVEGVVLEALPNKTYRVELANGHRLLAYITGKARLAFARFAPGERVNLELSPFDLSEGRIIVESKT